MVEGFAAIAGSFQRDGNIFFYAFLADVLSKCFWANTGVETHVVIGRGAGYDAGGAIVVGLFFGAERWHVELRIAGIGDEIAATGDRITYQTKPLAQKFCISVFGGRLDLLRLRAATSRNWRCLPLVSLR